jgi:hypothetical protein
MRSRRTVPLRVAVVLCALGFAAGILGAGKWDYKPSAAERAALAAISAVSLQAHLSFLSADALEGRGSGSAGLDVAAEYIAAQFRRAALKPAGDDGYFQTTPRVWLTPSLHGFQCRLVFNGGRVEVEPSQFALVVAPGTSAPLMRELRIEAAPVVKVPFGGPYPEAAGEPGRTVVITEFPPEPADAVERTAYQSRRDEFLALLDKLRPALVVEIRRDTAPRIDYFAARQLIDPQQKGKEMAGLFPTVRPRNGALAAAYEALPKGLTGALFTVWLGPPIETDAPQRNVIGLLEGSDPKLGGTYVLVTAHYDGQGIRPGADRVWNSANDNASGTASVIELASALATLKRHPRRSVVFIAFHGEESGLVGSRFYAEHPVFPLEKTIADINIEMVGRTDDSDGDKHKKASLTGFDYSDVGEVFRLAGVQTGVTVFKHEKNSAPYFGASDNRPLAAQGVPAHTICVAFQPPDYHGPADTWQKIDYENMALTVRTIGTALLILAESLDEPRWNPVVPGASRYLEAWKKRHGGN